MLFENGNEIKESPRDITVVSIEEQQQICDFLQGATYCWCQVNGKDEFQFRDFMGGGNKNWEGTPLMSLYVNHCEDKNQTEAAIAAGQDAGHLLKKVLMDDKRKFERVPGETPRQYRWFD